MSLPPLDVTRSTALVTGAAGGMGEHLARGLARRGAHVVLLDRDGAGLAQVAQLIRTEAPGVEVTTYEVDLSDRAAYEPVVARIVDAHPAINLVFNNAGVALGGTFADVSAEDFDWLLEVNLIAPIRITRAVLPLLRENGNAQVVNTSSLFGLVAPPGQSAYATSKFGLRGFSESLRHELAGEGIGVTVVHPGGIKTNIAVNARVAAGVSEKEAEKNKKAFAKMLSYPAPKAAEEIIEAAIAREGRLLIGNDAKFLGIMARLLPARYWSVASWLMSRAAKR